MELHLVDETGAQALLRDVRAARDENVPVARRRARLREGCLDAAGDEDERPSLQLERIALVMGEHERRDAEGRLVAPPAAGVRIVLPRPGAAAEHLPAHDHRAGRSA